MRKDSERNDDAEPGEIGIPAIFQTRTHRACPVENAGKSEIRTSIPI
jgi:hypothetical protein